MFAHWRSRGRVEGRRAAVVQSTAAVEAGRSERGRGRGRGEGGPPVWGTVGAPAPQVLCVEAPADVLWGAVGEGSRRYSTGNNTIYSIALVGR